MKTSINFFLCILCLTLGTSLLGQNKQINNITAIKLTAEVGEQYVNKVSIKAFTVDKKYILRPAKGYKIVHFAKEKKVVILPQDMKLSNAAPPVPGFDIAKVPGGTMFCMCGQANDDCNVDMRMADNTLFFDCNGRCGCASFVIYDTSYPVSDYETPGGGWFNF